ncbi:MAG: hypothetical protein FJW34_27070, partial [Acidobacteria bacterium]|nr:hypothetical protein [Acidobacteriota bacterium]
MPLRRGRAGCPLCRPPAGRRNRRHPRGSLRAGESGVTSDPVYVLRIPCASQDRDLLIAALWERNTCGIIEQDLRQGRCCLRAFFEQPFDMPGATWEVQEDVDWVRESQSLWQPALLGSRLYLTPPWFEGPTPPGRIRLNYEVGRACGTGLHPGTQLALVGLERCLLPGAAVLDLGAGSGILSTAATL